MFNEDVGISTSANGLYVNNIIQDETCNFDDIKAVLLFDQDEIDDS